MHTMTLMFSDSLGYYTFECPICQRAICIRFEPYERVVIEEGKPDACHTGGLRTDVNYSSVDRLLERAGL